MNDNIKKVVLKLQELKLTIATMESCTGGAVANAITNVEGASKIFKFGAVTYSNLYKVKMGVDDSIISKYSVYSIEVAKEMALQISKFTSANYGVGITGNLNGTFSKIYVCVYSKKNGEYIMDIVETLEGSRESKKKQVVDKVAEMMEDMLLR